MVQFPSGRRGKISFLVLAILALACFGLGHSDGGSSKKKRRPKEEDKKAVVDDKKDDKKEDKPEEKKERLKPVERHYLTRAELDADGAYTKAGALTERDFTEDGHYLKVFLVKLEANKTYDFDLESDEFDAYLRLVSPEGLPVLAGGDRIARLRHQSRQTGLYRLQVTTAKPGDKGPFTLKINEAGGKEPANKPIQLPAAKIEAGKPFYPFKQKFRSGATAYHFLFNDKAAYVGDVVWNKDGQSFFILERDGILRQINLESWTEERRLDLKDRCNNLAMSKEGLLVSVPGKQEVCLIDLEKLTIKKKIAAPSGVRVVSAPASSLAVIVSHPQAFRDKLAEPPADENAAWIILDIAEWKLVKQHEKRPGRFLTMSPDGGHLYAQNARRGISTWHWNGPDALQLGPSNEEIAKEAEALCMSPDGRYLCLPSPEGNSQKDFTPPKDENHSVFVYERPASGVSKPAFTLSAGPGTRVAGFDPTGQAFYLHNETKQLVVVNRQGGAVHDLFLGAKNAANDPREFRPHPNQEKVLVRFDNRLTLVTFKAPAQVVNKTPSLGEADRALRFVFPANGSASHEVEIGPKDKLPGAKHPYKTFYIQMEKGWPMRFYLRSSVFHYLYELYDPAGKVVDSLDFDPRGDNSAQRNPVPKESGLYKIRIHKLGGGNEARRFSITAFWENGFIPRAAREPVPVPAPQIVEETLKPVEIKLPDKATARLFALPAKDFPPSILDGVHWSPDGKTLFAADTQGVVYRINLEKSIVERKLLTGRSARGLGLSAQGLVLGVDQAVWVLDPETLAVKQQIDVPELRRVMAAPASPFVLLDASHGKPGGPILDKGKVHVLDLVHEEFIPHGKEFFRTDAMVLSPTGKHAFTESWQKGLLRWQLDDGVLGAHKETYKLSSGGWAICVSPDGKYVCFPSGEGNPEPKPPKKGKPASYATFIFEADKDLEYMPTPVLKLVTGPGIQVMGFDPKQNCILAMSEFGLLLYGWDGEKKKEFKLRGADKKVFWPEFRPREVVVSPQGGKVAMRYQNQIAIVDYSELPRFKEEPWDPKIPKPEPLAKEPIKAGNMVYRELDLPRRGGTFPCWDPEGKYIFHIEYPGVLHRIRVKDFISEASGPVGKTIQGMAWSREGLVILHLTPPEITVVDPKTLKVKATIPCPRFGKLAVNSEKSLALVTVSSVVTSGKKDMALIDLKKNEVIAKEIKDVPDSVSAYYNTVFSPDGKYLFLHGVHDFLRVRVDEAGLTFEEKRSMSEKRAFMFAPSPDGKLVAAYYDIPLFGLAKGAQPSKSEIFPLTSWKTPARSFDEAFYVLAFDGKGNLYAQDMKHKLTRTADPLKEDGKSTDLLWPHRRIRAIIPSPQGDTFLAITAIEKSTGWNVHYGQFQGK